MKIITAKAAIKSYNTREELYKLIHMGDVANMVKNFIKFYGENCLLDDLNYAINSSIKQTVYGNEIYDGKIEFSLGMLNGHLSVLNDIFNNQLNTYANAYVNSDGTTQVGMHIITKENAEKVAKQLGNKPQQTLSNKLKASIIEISNSKSTIDVEILYTTDTILKQTLTSAGYMPIKSNDPEIPFVFTTAL